MGCESEVGFWESKRRTSSLIRSETFCWSSSSIARSLHTRTEGFVVLFEGKAQSSGFVRRVLGIWRFAYRRGNGKVAFLKEGLIWVCSGLWTLDSGVEI